VSKDVGIRGYFSKPQGVRDQKKNWEHWLIFVVINVWANQCFKPLKPVVY
jgi:hypothetical protein